MYVYVCTCAPSPQGETVVDLVDEEHSKEFEELKTVAEAAQGVSAGRVGRCPTATHLSLPLSHCPSAVATYVLLVFKSPFIYIRTYICSGRHYIPNVLTYIQYVRVYIRMCIFVFDNLCTYVYVCQCVCVCLYAKMFPCIVWPSVRMYSKYIRLTKGGCVAMLTE